MCPQIIILNICFPWNLVCISLIPEFPMSRSWLKICHGGAVWQLASGDVCNCSCCKVGTLHRLVARLQLQPLLSTIFLIALENKIVKFKFFATVVTSCNSQSEHSEKVANCNLRRHLQSIHRLRECTAAMSEASARWVFLFQCVHNFLYGPRYGIKQRNFS